MPIPIQKKKIVKLEDMIELELVKAEHKYLNNKLLSMICVIFRNNTHYHTYNTRKRNNPTIHRHTKSIFNRSILYICKMPSSWGKYQSIKFHKFKSIYKNIHKT